MKKISESANEVISAIEIHDGIIVKSVTKDDNGNQSESLIEIKGGVIVNHGTLEEPIWKLNR